MRCLSLYERSSHSAKIGRDAQQSVTNLSVSFRRQILTENGGDKATTKILKGEVALCPQNEDSEILRIFVDAKRQTHVTYPNKNQRSLETSFTTELKN